MSFKLARHGLGTTHSSPLLHIRLGNPNGNILVWWMSAFWWPLLLPGLSHNLICQLEPPSLPVSSQQKFPCLFCWWTLSFLHNSFFSLLMIWFHHTFRFLPWIFCYCSGCFLSQRELEGSTLSHHLPRLFRKDYQPAAVRVLLLLALLILWSLS